MSALSAVRDFLNAASRGRWDDALLHAQTSWVQDTIDRGHSPSRQLERAFTMLGVIEARIGGDARAPGLEPASHLMLDVPVELDTKFGPMRALIRVIRELGPYQPSEHGVWGVHPPSIRRTIRLQAEDDSLGKARPAGTASISVRDCASIPHGRLEIPDRTGSRRHAGGRPVPVPDTAPSRSAAVSGLQLQPLQ